MSFIRSLALGLAAGLSAALSGDPFGSGGVLFSDDFNREDSATTLGAPWTTLGGSVWGIASEQARLVTSGTIDIAYVDAGSPNVRITVTLAAHDTLWNWRIAGRIVDEDNYIRLAIPGSSGDGNFYLTRVTGGAGTDLDSGAVTVIAGDTFALEFDDEDNIKVYHNDVEVGAATDAQGSAASLHGLESGNGNTALRYDNVVISAT